MHLILVHSPTNVSEKNLNVCINLFSCSRVKAELLFEYFSGNIYTTLLPHSDIEYVGNENKRAKFNLEAEICSQKSYRSVMISKL